MSEPAQYSEKVLYDLDNDKILQKIFDSGHISYGAAIADIYMSTTILLFPYNASVDIVDFSRILAVYKDRYGDFSEYDRYTL